MENGKVNFRDKNAFLLWCESLEGKYVVVSVGKYNDTRTKSQNNAIHLFCKQVAETLNESGLTIEKVVQNFKFEHEWTTSSVKELLWREAQRHALGKESTKELSKIKEIEQVWELVNRFLAKLKVESIPFPSIETQFNELGK